MENNLRTDLMDATRIALRVVGVLVLGAIFGLALKVNISVQQASKDENTLAVKLGNDADEAHRLILEAGLTAMEARKASAEERGYLAVLNTKTSATLDSANDLLVSARKTSDGVRVSQAEIARETTATLRTTSRAIDGIVPVEENASNAAASLNKLVANPDIPKTLAHVDAAAGNVQDISADAKAKVHSVLHPKWFTKTVNVAERVAVDVGKVVF